MRFIPPQLLAHKKQDATTTTKLIKIIAKDGTTLGVTELDKDVTYNDGAGPLIYRAPIGFQPASIYESNGFEVNNSEFESLVVPEYDFDIDEFSVNAGKWDYAAFIMYEVNYEDLSMGHAILMSGQLGQMKSHNGIQMFGEMRSIADLFRRNIVQPDSLTCRAIFGSDYSQERFPCLYNAEELWVDGEVTSVGVENNRVFFDSTRTEDTGHFKPGMIQFLTGENAGKYIEIEEFINDGTTTQIALTFTTSYGIAVGDTYRIRRDCNKQARDSAKGCKHWFGSDWGLHFRGEPDIPVGDIGNLTTPGASTETIKYRGIEIEVPTEGGE